MLLVKRLNLTNYPDSIDNSISLPLAVDNLTPVQGKVVNDLRAAIVAIEKELGVKPSSVYGTVSGRLDTLESIIHSGGGGAPTGGSQSLMLSASPNSTNNISTSKSVIGAAYFTLPAGTQAVHFEGIIQTSSISGTVNIDLLDVNGITNGGTPTVIASSAVSYNANPGLYHFSVVIPELLTAVGSGILQAELYTNNSLVSVLSYSAKINF